ncbi:MAG: serine hydrolase, partial [Marivirga sp.]|nr:serine hydrolase [Marivirga sp.]
MKIFWTLLLCLIQTAFINFDCRSQHGENVFDKIMNDQFEPDGPGGVVLIAKEGRTIYRKSFGKANLELGVAVHPDHVFRIG